MAEQYINFFIPDEGNWKALDLTRTIEDYPGLSDRLAEFVTKTDLYQNYEPSYEGVDFDSNGVDTYLKTLKVKIGLFPDAVLGQMICAGNCTTINPQYRQYAEAKSIARFVRRFRRDAFRTVGQTIFTEIFQADTDNPSYTTLRGISFTYQGNTYGEVKLKREVIQVGQAIDMRLEYIEFGDIGKEIVLTKDNITQYLNDDLIFISDLNEKQWDYFSDPADVTLEWNIDMSNESIIYEVVSKKTGLKLANMEDYQFYITKRPGTMEDKDNSILWLGYDCFSSFFFHLVVDKSSSEMYIDTFNGMTYTDGDWLVPTTEGWQLVTAIAIVGNINDQSSGGNIYTYNGPMSVNETNGGYTYHKGSWYYNDLYDVYANNTPTSLINALVLCTQTVNSNEVSSDVYDQGAGESNRITYNFSKYFTTPNKLLTKSFLLPISFPAQEEPIISSSSATEILIKYSEWMKSLEDYIESTSGGSIPLEGDYTGQDALIYTNKETWGRHVIYYKGGPEDSDQMIYTQYETGTQPESPSESKLNFYIEIPRTTNEGS